METAASGNHRKVAKVGKKERKREWKASKAYAYWRICCVDGVAAINMVED